MKKYSLIAAIVLAGCGGGGGDEVVRVDPPVKPSPQPPAAAQPPAAQPPAAQPPAAPPPAPVATPVPAKPAPEEPPVTEPPAGPPPVAGPPPPPEPEPGTYITGKLLRAALNQFPTESPKPAYQDGDRSKLEVRLNYFGGGTYWYHYTWPHAMGGVTPGYTPAEFYRKFPQQTIDFPVDYGTDGVYGLSRQISTYTYQGRDSGNAVLIRDERFKIVEEGKYLLNTSIATWYGVEGSPWFVQLQVATLDGAPAVFKLCMHTLLPHVRRLSCSLHDKDTGEYRGTHIIDDSDGLGPVLYEPAR